MTHRELVLQFADQAALSAEYTRNLMHGRAFVPGAHGLSVFSDCLLTLEHPDTHVRLQVACQVVMVFEQGEPGVALQFADRSESALSSLAAFLRGRGTTPSASTVPPDGSWPSSDSEPDPALDDELDDGESNPAQRALVEARALKLRSLTPLQRMQVARGSVLEDRVLLERIYGSAVWELLLRNPKVTIPEVARMARKGTMPRPLLDVIADNEQWIRHSLVRRALLANPRLGSDAIMRVLRALPPRELKLVPQQTAYPALVRQAAVRLMRGS